MPDVPSRLFVSFVWDARFDRVPDEGDLCGVGDDEGTARGAPPEEKRETPLCREEEWKDVVVDEMVDAREEREEDTIENNCIDD